MTNKMELTETGWVVINIGHPRTGDSFIVGSTFSRKRTISIENFITGSGCKWRYWRDKYNFRVVRSTQTVSI